jgi:RNA polymerase sigma factor (sigma-70 family)
MAFWLHGSYPILNTIFGRDIRLNKQRMKSLTVAEQIPGPVDARLEKTVTAERRHLFEFIRRRVRTAEDAEDILQDVLYQVVTSYDVADPIERLTAWLFRVARNKVIDWYRKQKPEPFPRSESNAGEPARLEDILYDSSMSPDTLYGRSVVWTELAEALDDLPDEQREVFVMHELEGKSFKEIAVGTGESVNTLLSRKRYAVLALRERLQDLYDEFETTT